MAPIGHITSSLAAKPPTISLMKPHSSPTDAAAGRAWRDLHQFPPLPGRDTDSTSNEIELILLQSGQSWRSRPYTGKGLSNRRYVDMNKSWRVNQHE